MRLSNETIDRMLWWLKKIDDSIDALKDALAREDVAESLARVREAEDRKRRIITLCPPAVKDLYDIFFYLDLAADTASRFPAPGTLTDGITAENVIENLEQSLDDLEFVLEDNDFRPDVEKLLEDMVGWLKAMLKHFKDKPPGPKPPAPDPRQLKSRFFDALDPKGLLEGLFGYLEILNREFYCAGRLLRKKPPEFAEARSYIETAEENKHLFMDWLRERRSDRPDPPKPGAEDLPPHHDHA